MTQRESSMLRVLFGLVGVMAAGGLFYYFFLRPLNEIRQEEALAAEAVAKKEAAIQALVKDRMLLKTARERSLPSTIDRAALDYRGYLDSVMERAGLAEVKLEATTSIDAKGTSTAKTKKPLTALSFRVNGRGYLENVVKALETLQSTPLMQRVKAIKLEPVADRGDGYLSVYMDVEAMSLHSVPAEHKPKLASGEKMDPPGTHPERSYAQVSKRNFFLGYIPVPPPKPKEDETPTVEPPETPPRYDWAEFVYLDQIVPTSNEAYLRNRLMPPDHRTRLRTTAGFNSFSITDDENPTKVLISGKVLKITQRQVFFQSGEFVYAWHIGQHARHAMRRIATDEELKEAGVTALPVDEKKKEVKKTRFGK